MLGERVQERGLLVSQLALSAGLVLLAQPGAGPERRVAFAGGARELAAARQFLKECRRLVDGLTW
ncbi:hypothetical protein [Kitasatospora sp. NPDC001132]